MTLHRMDVVSNESASLRYPYTHHGPAVFGSKLADYLFSEAHLCDDYPELFESAQKEPSE
jgi:hypothetical protein